MNKQILPFLAAVLILAASCGGQQPTGVAESADAQSQITAETITKEILSLPEMQFPNAAVMIVDEPTDAEPYFTIKGGSDMDDHFATSFWFHVYTAPEYEIRLYDIVSDSEMTLEEWRNSNSAYDEVWKETKNLDRTTKTLTETDLPFTIPSAHEFDSEEFDEEQTYWRSEYIMCENGDVIVAAAPSMNATCITLAHWDEKEGFTLYKRGIIISHGEPVEDNDAAEMYVKNTIRPNFQRINAIEKWTWIDEKNLRNITPQPATLTYYYSDKGLEKIVAALANETVEYYFLERYLSFVYSKSDAGTERRWYVKKGSCFRGLGDNGKKMSPEEREEEYEKVDEMFRKIMGR